MTASSSLLGQVALRVLPAAVLVLLLIWVSVGHVSEHTFQAEVDAKLKQQAESQALVAKTKLENLSTTVRDIAGNDLIVNGLIDLDTENSYLQPFLRSVAIEGSADFPIVLTDYRGRPMVGRRLQDWQPTDLTRWNEQISLESPVMTLQESGLVIGMPVYIGHLVEGMLAVRIPSAQLRQLISPIGARGNVEILTEAERAGAADDEPSSMGEDAYALVELALPESEGLWLRSIVPAGEAASESSYFQGFMLTAFALNLIALVCGIFAAVYLVIKPLTRFIEHLRRSQRDGQLDPFDAGECPSEIRLLADAFNRFVTSEQELLQERSEQTERLKAALEREKELSGLQRQFVSMVCHEFRTPLAIVDGNAYRLLRRHQSMPPERLEDALKKIRLSVTRLTDLMESVLSAARLEAGTIKFEPGANNPARLIQEVIANHLDVNPGYRLNADLERLPETFVMDAKLMRQVISNLLSNAIKYSAEGIDVWIDASSTEDGGLTISVRDEGLGIPKEELSRLFDRFFRASTSTGIAGTGIGLHMVKALVDLHHGRVEVASELDEGTIFSVYLPQPKETCFDPAMDDAEAA
ncbi:MAG: sensor histidine kinase [Geminicoccaceae bacterium]